MSDCDQALLPTRKAGVLSLGLEAWVQDVLDCKALGGKLRVKPGLRFSTELRCILPCWFPHFWFL